MQCLGIFAVFAIVLGGIVGLGWMVIQPLGYINRARVKVVRFQTLDVFWLVLLLQPSLVLFANLVSKDRRFAAIPWIAIFILVWVCTLVSWYAVTGSLSKVGVSGSSRRAAALLVILPMIGAINPMVIFLHFVLLARLITRSSAPFATWELVAYPLADIAFVASLFGCRKLSRWIAKGVQQKDNIEESASELPS